ncbi:MAG: type II toxin-antitoxin system Phd/YefM family antitoxin [Firmicutes bacterium]|nr:type II toxin-antitoxin system Phd/YefM family antitoxin [Bacillota bacterium]
MIVNTQNTLSITEANQHFSRAVHMADRVGEIIIYKRNKPQYALINLEKNPRIEMSDEEKILFVAQRILRQHLNAFKELAK